MKKLVDSLEDMGNVESADILIAGGGIAGLSAAVKIKEINEDLDVLVVDKATTGHSGGKANKGAGVLCFFDEDDDIDEFMEYHPEEIGEYLEDQELLEDYAHKTREVIEHFDRWGINIVKDDEGEIDSISPFPHWSLLAIDHNMMDILRKRAEDLGVRTVNKTQIVELLTAGDRVVGAAGFNIIDGSFSVFKAKSVLLATGSCNWMEVHMWKSGRGDGIAAAYRAGAEMRNAEYSNFYNIGLRGNRENPVGSWNALYNDEGERLAPKYCDDPQPDINIELILGMEKEVKEGRGPIVYDETEFFARNPLSGSLFSWDRPNSLEFWETLMRKQEEYSSDYGWRKEAIPAFIGECSCVKVDHNMKTTLDGLWALGDTSHTGSANEGAVPQPCRMRGSGLMFAAFSALQCSQNVVEETESVDVVEPDFDQVEEIKERIYDPMDREEGLDIREHIFKLREAVAPPRYSARKSEDRIEEALAMVEHIQGKLQELSPENDWHMLGLYHDLRNMALCAEIYFKSALAREESRGWHYREDYPERDDENWLKWVVVRKEDGGMNVTTEDIPIEDYKHQP